MNRTIQSNSYRSFSESLLKQWINHFAGIAGQNFLYQNLLNSLVGFEKFASSFSQKAIDLSKSDKDFLALGENGRKNYAKWLNEKINKALDAYWFPLSQAATQYTSPAYEKHVKTFIELSPTLNKYLEKLNQLAGTSDLTKITINDLVLFFDELTQIRLAPYTKTALIGVPFRVIETASSSAEEKLASIAHELGHFLYWRLGIFNQIEIRHQEILGQISDFLKNKRPDQDEREIRFIRAWFEELFADFIGTNIAGDPFVESCKEMIIRYNKTGLGLEENDQEHIPDILRPLACIYTLDRNRESSKASWKQFFNENFQIDIDTKPIKIVTARENESQKSIARSPEEISKILLDAIDILIEQTEREDKGFLHTSFSEVTSPEQLQDKAGRLEVMQAENPALPQDKVLSAIEIFLEPRILEAGGQKHEHEWKTTSPHSHKETRSHSH